MKDAGKLIAASRLLLGENPQRALDLLLSHRCADTAELDVAILRAAFLARDRQCIIDTCGRLIEAKQKLRPDARKLMTDALILNGSLLDALQVVEGCMSDGLRLQELSGREQIVLHDRALTAGNHPLASEIVTISRMKWAMPDPSNEALFFHCPKNACTVLKTTMVMNGKNRDDFLRSSESIHNFCSRRWPAQLKTLPAGYEDWFRFTVVRDPAKRLLSAYLNKFVTKAPLGPAMRFEKQLTIAGAQQLLGIAVDFSRSISFREFCIYLANISDAQLNAHWRPQWRCLGQDATFYQHVGHVESLDDTFAFLKSRFGYVQEPDPVKHGSKSFQNITRFDQSARVSNPCDMLPADLLKLKSSGYPMPGAFIVAEIGSMIEKRFDGDYRLIASTQSA